MGLHPSSGGESTRREGRFSFRRRAHCSRCSLRDARRLGTSVAPRPYKQKRRQALEPGRAAPRARAGHFNPASDPPHGATSELRHSSGRASRYSRWVLGDIHTIFSQAHGDGARLRVRPHRGLREEAGATVLALSSRAPARGGAGRVTALAARLGAAPASTSRDPVPRGAVDCVGAAHADADAAWRRPLTPPPTRRHLFVRGPRRFLDVAGVARHIEKLPIEEGPVLCWWRRAADFGEALAVELETRVGSCGVVVAGAAHDEVDRHRRRRWPRHGLRGRGGLSQRRVAFVGAAGSLRDAVAAGRGGACLAVDPNGAAAADALASQATRVGKEAPRLAGAPGVALGRRRRGAGTSVSARVRGVRRADSETGARRT